MVSQDQVEHYGSTEMPGGFLQCSMAHVISVSASTRALDVDTAINLVISIQSKLGKPGGTFWLLIRIQKSLWRLDSQAEKKETQLGKL